MATVQVNDKLKDRTEAVIRSFHTAENKRLDEAFRRNLPHNGDDIYRKLVGEDYLHWLSQAPKGMFDMVGKLTVGTIGEHGVNMDMPLDHAVPTPPNKISLPGGSLDCGFKSNIVHLDPAFAEWEPLIEPSVILGTRRERLKDDMADLIAFVRLLFRQHKSLGPVLRMWHPLWDLISFDDRQRQGAKPYGARLPIPAYIGDETHVNRMTGLVVRIKMASR